MCEHLATDPQDCRACERRDIAAQHGRCICGWDLTREDDYDVDPECPVHGREAVA